MSGTTATERGLDALSGSVASWLVNESQGPSTVLTSGSMIFLIFSVLSAAMYWAFERKIQNFLKHLQIYQVLRAQFLRPYVVKDSVIWPRYTNQLGNNLFQYAYARLRAKYLGLRFAAGQLNQDVFHADVAKLTGKGDKSGENSNPFSKASPFEFLESQADYSGANYANFSQKLMSQYPEMSRVPSNPDLRNEADRQEKFLKSTPNAFAQHMKFYEKDCDLIRAWMCPSVESHSKSIARANALGVGRDDTIVFHLRFAGAVEGIFADPTYHELPFSYYTDVLRRHGKCARAILVHDPKSKGSAQAVARLLKSESPSLEITQQCASRCDDFVVMYMAKNLALSVSTFAWWAGFLGRKHKQTIFYPRHKAVSWYNPRRLKTWYNQLMPSNDAAYLPVFYTTAKEAVECKANMSSSI